MKKILAFSGSNSANSINQQLINAAALGEESIDVIDLRNYPAPLYGIDLEGQEGIPQTMVDLRERMRGYDGFLVSSPEHNGSMPAFFKNTLDWLSRQEGKIFQEKPVVFLTTSPGPRGGASCLEHLNAVMPYRGANIIGSHAVGSFGEKVKDGELVAGDDKDIVMSLVSDLIKAL